MVATLNRNIWRQKQRNANNTSIHKCNQLSSSVIRGTRTCRAGTMELVCSTYSSEQWTMSVLIIWCHAASADAIIVTGQRGGGETLSCFFNSTFVSKCTGQLEWRHVALIYMALYVHCGSNCKKIEVITDHWTENNAAGLSNRFWKKWGENNVTRAWCFECKWAPCIDEDIISVVSLYCRAPPVRRIKHTLVWKWKKKLQWEKKRKAFISKGCAWAGGLGQGEAV